MKQFYDARVPFTLIGEEISGEWNALALADIARAFGGEYAPYAACASVEAHAEGGAKMGLPCADADLLNEFDWLLAAENGHETQSIYALKPPMLQNRALVVGNEAKGLRRRTRKRAHAVAEIPVVSQNINCLNVAAAAAIMLYYLDVNVQRAAPLGQAARTWTAVQKARPDILLVGGQNPMELGSVIRSACAFGWERVFLDDRHNAWYDCDRLMKSEGRGAARRGRNPIKVIPCPADLLDHYKTLVVVTSEAITPEPNEAGGQLLCQTPLIQKSTVPTLIVLPDESVPVGNWVQLTPQQHRVVRARLPVVSTAHYHYRQAASIGLAEIARQFGCVDGKGIYLQDKKHRYQKTVGEEAGTAAGNWIDLEDLCIF